MASILDHEVTIAELIYAAKELSSEVPYGFSDYDRALVALVSKVAPDLVGPSLPDIHSDDERLAAIIVLGK